MSRKHKNTSLRIAAILEGRYSDDAGHSGVTAVMEALRGDPDDPKAKRTKASDISFRDLAESVCGHTAWWKDLVERHTGGSGGGYMGDPASRDFMEAGTATSLSDFQDIIGQLIFNEIRDGFTQERFVFSELVPTIQSDIAGTEKVPEIKRVGDVATEVLENEEYDTFGFGSNTYTRPKGVKKGLIVDVTEEALFFDRTGGRVARQANSIGQDLGLTKEKRLIDVFIGQVNNYIRNDTGTNSYLTSGAYTNASVIALLDETDIDEVEQAIGDILDPDTSEPIELTEGATQLICVPALKRLALRISRSTEVRQTDGSNITTIAPPTIENQFQVVSSKQLYRRILAGPQSDTTKAKTWWFWCAIAEFMAWKENWPLQLFMQGPTGPHAFSRDVPLRTKARYRGEAYILEARKSYRAGNAT